jgi:hypothetical protein
MTERIDLDDLDVETDADEDRPNRGDWFWSGEGDPDDEPGPDADDRESDSTADGEGTDADDGAAADGDRIPRVPRQNEDRPVGVPEGRGGAGAGPGQSPTGGVPGDPPGSGGESGAASGSDAGTEGDDTGTETTTPREDGVDDGHDTDVGDMTMALTYGAVQRLDDPRAVLADAEGWTDWVGIVGDVEAHVVNKFQRDHGVDVDFFNGAGSDAAERLASIGRRSMFYAERMVVVGLPDDEALAEQVGWEFVPLSEAAGEAGWDLADAD